MSSTYGSDEPDKQALADAEDALVLLAEGDALDAGSYFPGIPDYDLFGRPSWGSHWC